MDYNKAKKAAALIIQAEQVKESIKRTAIARNGRHTVCVLIPVSDIYKPIHEGLNDEILEYIETCLAKNYEAIKREIENID